MPKNDKLPDKSAKTAAKAAIAKNQPVLRAIKGGKGAAKAPSGKHDPAKTHPAAPDDTPVIALKLEAAKLSPAMAAYFKKCQDKLGFVPNVLLAYAFDMTTSIGRDDLVKFLESTGHIPRIERLSGGASTPP